MNVTYIKKVEAKAVLDIGAGVVGAPLATAAGGGWLAVQTEVLY